MTKKVTNAGRVADLRKQAEEIARKKEAQSPENLELLSLEETRQMLRELRVHQIELEMQNEVLRRIHMETEATKIPADEAREYAEGMINTVREPLIVLDQDLRVVTASRSFYEFFKVSPEETVGQLIYDLGNKQWDIPKLRELLETILPQRTTFDDYEVDHDFATIGRRIMLLNARQIQEVLSKERIILLAIEDITVRKQTEKALKESNERFSAIADYTYDWENWIGTDGKLIWINSAVLPFTGYSADECLTMMDFPFPLIDESDHEAVRQHLATAFQGSTGANVEFRVRCKDGRLKWAGISWQPIYDSEGVSMGHRSSIRDITDRKQAEEALQQAGSRLSLAARAGGVGIWDYDIINNHLKWDNQMFILYGITPDQFSGAYEAWKEGLYPDDLLRGDKEIQMALRGEKDFDTEFRVVWPDGTIRNIRALAIVQRNTAGQPTHMIGTNWDITANKQTEEQLLLAREVAEAANLAKSSFLANMSHEIRTPMSGMLGMTGLLLGTSLTDKQRNYAEKIRTSGNSLLAILNDILDFSRINAGKLTLENVPFSMEDVMENVVNIFGSLVAEKGIRLQATIAPELTATLLGDPLRLAQVINNLMGNAVKFTQAGEIRLTVKARRQTSAEVDLEISVQDTGIGMTEEELSRLFTTFGQADESTTRRFGGTGLGLAISRQLVELMGGTIRAESTPGEGSVFTVVLSFPVAPEIIVQDMPLRPVKPREGFTGVRALVAEDHELHQEIITELLRQLGIDVDIARNGKEVLEMVRAQDYDILFMDIQMPEMDGIEAAREIRKLDKGSAARLPILALTALAMTGDREKSLDAGMNDHLNKPVDLDLLIAALRRWLPDEKYAAVTVDDPAGA